MSNQEQHPVETKAQTEVEKATDQVAELQRESDELKQKLEQSASVREAEIERQLRKEREKVAELEGLSQSFGSERAARLKAEQIANDLRKAEADRAKAEAEAAKKAAEKPPEPPQPAPKPATPEPSPPVRTGHEASGQCCCHPYTRTWMVATIIAIVLILGGAAVYYFASSSPAAPVAPSQLQPAPVPSIYRVVPDDQGNPTLKKVGEVLWRVVGGTARAEDKAVAVPTAPSVVIYDDRAAELARAEADLRKAEAEKAKIEEDLVEGRKEIDKLRSKANASSSQKATAEAKVNDLELGLENANKALKRAAEDLDIARELVRQAELKEAKGEASQNRLNSLLTAGQGGMEVWQSILPTEDPVMGMVRKTCPLGTAPEFVRIGGNTRFSCESVLSAPALLLPAKEEGEKESTISLILKGLAWVTVGGLGGMAANVGVVHGFDRDADLRTAAFLGLSGGIAMALGGYLLSLPAPPPPSN